jgi:sortase (surface protein transpeptidase)
VLKAVILISCFVLSGLALGADHKAHSGAVPEEEYHKTVQKVEEDEGGEPEPAPEPEAVPAELVAPVIQRAAAPPVAQALHNHLEISAIGLNANVSPVAINGKGEIDVPAAGVGLWNGGAQPGGLGNVFLDGHVYGVFRNLHGLGAGQTIQLTWNERNYNYRVVSNSTYSLDELLANGGALWSNILYNAPSGKGLTIMTCAGSPMGATYSHRTVVKAVEI